MWRLLSPWFGVLEAADAQGARDWLACRRDIDALVVPSHLPDAERREFLPTCAEEPLGARAVVVVRPADPRKVVMRLPDWSAFGDMGSVRALVRAATQADA